MKSFQKGHTVREKASVILTGAAAGALNGFLGSGGGIVLLFAYRRLTKENERDAFASVVATVLPLSAVSAVIYSSRGMGNAGETVRYILPAVLGGVCGAYLTDKLNTAVLRKIFAFIVTVAGINMLF